MMVATPALVNGRGIIVAGVRIRRGRAGMSREDFSAVRRRKLFGCRHLSHNLSRNGEGGFFCARCEITGRANAGRAALLAEHAG